MKTRLNQTMVEGVEILSVKALPETAGNAMASVAAAGYTIRIRPGHEPSFPFGEQFDAFMAQQEIPYEKATKKSVKALDLKLGIFDYHVTENSIYLLVDASSSGNIKPGMVMDAYYQFCHAKSGEFDFLITREETYTRDSSGKLIPLDAVGKDI
jgi:radical SAM-linked protein